MVDRYGPTGQRVSKRTIPSGPLKYSGKIALCFLTVTDLASVGAWMDWWDGYEEYVSIYAHYSNKNNVTQSLLTSNRVPAIPTKWGSISLVRAEGNLYREAFKNRENVFFVLLSGSDVPVRPFAQVYRRLMLDMDRGIASYRDVGAVDDAEYLFRMTPRCRKLYQKYKMGEMRAMDQWKALSRANVRDFLEMLRRDDLVTVYKLCIKHVEESLAPDELMFATYLMRKYGTLKHALRRGHVTYVDFSRPYIHAKTFRGVKRIADDVCNVNAMFARKYAGKDERRLRRQLPIEC
jgi:hypothetical protein